MIFLELLVFLYTCITQTSPFQSQRTVRLNVQANFVGLNQRSFITPNISQRKEPKCLTVVLLYQDLTRLITKNAREIWRNVLNGECHDFHSLLDVILLFNLIYIFVA